MIEVMFIKTTISTNSGVNIFLAHFNCEISDCDMLRVIYMCKSHTVFFDNLYLHNCLMTSDKTASQHAGLTS